MWLTHDVTHRTAFVICEIRSVIDSKPSHECLRANVQAEMVNQTRESTNSKLCGWSTGKLFPFHLGDPENQVRVRSSARLLSSGVWPGHWRTPFFALRNSRVDFAVCFGLSICSVKRRLISFAAFGWIWAAVLYTLVHPATFVSSHIIDKHNLQVSADSQACAITSPSACFTDAVESFGSFLFSSFWQKLIFVSSVKTCSVTSAADLSLCCVLFCCASLCVCKLLHSFSIRWCFWPLQATVLSRFLSVQSSLAVFSIGKGLHRVVNAVYIHDIRHWLWYTYLPKSLVACCGLSGLLVFFVQHC